MKMYVEMCKCYYQNTYLPLKRFTQKYIDAMKNVNLGIISTFHNCNKIHGPPGFTCAFYKHIHLLLFN